jgi:hypothetical protein
LQKVALEDFATSLAEVSSGLLDANINGIRPSWAGKKRPLKFSSCMTCASGSRCNTSESLISVEQPLGGLFGTGVSWRHRRLKDFILISNQIEIRTGDARKRRAF